MAARGSRVRPVPARPAWPGYRGIRLRALRANGTGIQKANFWHASSVVRTRTSEPCRKAGHRGWSRASRCVRSVSITVRGRVAVATARVPALCAAVLGISLTSEEAPERSFCSTRRPEWVAGAVAGAGRQGGPRLAQILPGLARDWYTGVDGGEGPAGARVGITARRALIRRCYGPAGVRCQGSGRAAGLARRPRCDWRRRACPGCGSRAF